MESKTLIQKNLYCLSLHRMNVKKNKIQMDKFVALKNCLNCLEVLEATNQIKKVLYVED